MIPLVVPIHVSWSSTMMNLHLQSLLPFLFLTAVGATGMPGDVYDWKSLPEWWFNMGTQYGTYEFRK
jgi:hypothetical protein